MDLDKKSLGMAVDQTLDLMKKYPEGFIVYDAVNCTMKSFIGDGKAHTT